MYGNLTFHHTTPNYNLTICLYHVSSIFFSTDKLDGVEMNILQISACVIKFHITVENYIYYSLKQYFNYETYSSLMSNKCSIYH